MTAGVGGAGPDGKLWVLSDLDRGDDIVGQFAPQGVTRNVAARIPVGSAANSQYPILQWVAGELESISFAAKLWATDSEDTSVRDRLNRLEDLVKRNSDLKRIPICAFSWGDVASLSVTCLVKSLGGITYDEVREDGSLRGVTLQIQLARFEEYEFKVTDPSVPERFTRIRRAKRGDTYESVALDEYGDPELGVVLRQLNPRAPGMPLADLRANDPIHVFPEEHLLTQSGEPEFRALRSGPGNEAAEEVRRNLFEARGGDAWSTHLADGAAGDA